MSFENFMELALYDSEYGYYAASIADVGGRGGDFATSATLSGGLGRAIAGWIEAEKKERGWKGRIPIIEVGAGGGSLAREILRGLGAMRRFRYSYHIVDLSGPLIAKQRKRLRGSGVIWHESISAALDRVGGKALILSNELVDAFPARILEWRNGEWGEVFVQFSLETGVREELVPFSGKGFSAMDEVAKAEGQRIEIQPSFRDWMTDLSRKWKAGAMLTIDYGGEAEELYDRRPKGSLRGYYRHERVAAAAIYRRFGKQDLTVDVNFTDLRNWGEELGWETVSYEKQGEFLQRHGQGSDAMAGAGVGEAFQVLVQGRG